MLFLFTGTDREKVRDAVQKELTQFEKKGYTTLRVTDSHMLEDLQAAFRGGGMFDGPRIVIFENVLTNEDMEPLLRKEFVALAESKEPYVVVEEKIDAATRKQIEKRAEKSERFDAPKEYDSKEAFALANALQRRNKKALWVGYMKEIAKGSRPEMLHGILFWAAKQQLLRSLNDVHARNLVAALAELPHKARRQGFELEYALEHFVLSQT